MQSFYNTHHSVSKEYLFNPFSNILYYTYYTASVRVIGDIFNIFNNFSCKQTFFKNSTNFKLINKY